VARNTGASTVKLYYRIGEVAGIVGVEPHVLRYWETEFPSIRPQKSRSGQRVYSRRDVDKLLRVKELLYAQRFTIAGARQRLKEGGPQTEPLSLPAADTAPEGSVDAPRALSGGEASEANQLSLRLRAALLDVRCDVLRMLEGLERRSQRLGRETDPDVDAPEPEETTSAELPLVSLGTSARSYDAEASLGILGGGVFSREQESTRGQTRVQAQARDDSDPL
jgi:DNA-binding transcriptional MerR regulator